MPISEQTQLLSDREAGDAIAMIKNITEQNRAQPWYMQVWFNAPHGPWETIPSGEAVYSKHYGVPLDFWEKHMCGKDRLRAQRSWQCVNM